MNKLDVATLLRLHYNAYQLLLYIDQRSMTQPQWLAPQVAEQLASRRTAAQWLADHRSELPADLLPESEHVEPFANLFASFFQISFEVEHVEFENALLSARIRSGLSQADPHGRSTREVVAAALKYALANEGIRLTIPESRQLAKNTDIQTETRILAYVWELDRRARGKSKGAVVHTLWRSLPSEARRNLDEDTLWLEKQVVLNAANTMKSGEA